MKKHISPTPPTAKLTFTKETLRTLSNTVTDDQLMAVAGGMMSAERSKSTSNAC